MDLSIFEPVKDGVFVQLRSPISNEPLADDKGKAIGLRLVGADSAEFRDYQRNAINFRIQQGKKLKVSAESSEADAIAQLAACIVGFENIELDGKPLAFSKESAKDMLKRLSWVFEQVNEAVVDRSLFLKASQKS